MIKSIARKEIRLLLKEKGTFFWLLVLPILFIVLFASVFGSAGSSTIKVQYLDMDHTAASKELLQSIERIDGFELKTDSTLSLEKQIASIRDGKLSALLVLPQGFEASLQSGTGPAEVTLYRDETANSSVAPIQAVLHNIAGSYRDANIAQALASSGMNEAKLKQVLTPPIHVAEKTENVVPFDMISQVVPGYTVMFVFFVIISMTRRFISDKDTGMTARLSSTPMRPLSYLIGMWIPYLLVVIFQCAVLLSFGHFVYGLELGDMLSVIIIILALAFCVTGLGLALSVFAKSENQGIAFTQLIAMGGAVIGGLWFPTEMMPKFMQTIGHFTPQYWAQQGLKSIILHGAHLQDIWLNVLILLAFAVVALLIAMLQFPRFMRQAAH
ncbi:ABC transporter permease [Paenibacillus sp. MER TA 81-3]|uniref:ABC transporter permease n=1 Tax=Paenibacillus sp. MER TA 81-3 TaxID=2939573 RepID=UPI00203E32F2|nr:ABC transporter permease [Paenibacillus sp. MER TA 81-3]MCM3338210.1 ABC transporter permease [Paenibacillus sp. MER TA 81-3]